MPFVNTNPYIIVDAEGLLSAVEANKELLPNIDEHKAPVVEGLTRIKSLRTLQQTLIADKQKVTQELKAAFRETRDMTIQLRAVIRGKVGIRNEKLVEFKVPPLRKRSRRSRSTEPEEVKK
jgi:hypothetical protein